MLNLLLPDLLDIHTSNILQDIFIIMMLYIFLKLTLLGSLIELVWPTHFFNKRNLTTTNSFRIRSFIEVIIKLQLSGVSLNTALPI